MAMGPMAPAPMPWTARAPMSSPMDGARPASTEPSRNTVTPNSRTGLRPNMSATLPYTGTVTAWPSR